MVYPYITLADGTEIVHTQVFEEQGIQKVEVHFERPAEDGFDTARCQLPSYTWLIKEGFSAEEMDFFDRFMHSNAHLFYKYGTNGGYRLPNLFTIGSYKVFFWSNENDEPIHVHIAKGTPTANATKVWLTRDGGCIVADNKDKISSKELRSLLEIIQA